MKLRKKVNCKLIIPGISRTKKPQFWQIPKNKPGNAANPGCAALYKMPYSETVSAVLALPKVNRTVNPTAAGSKFILSMILSSGFQSNERFSGRLVNL